MTTTNGHHGDLAASSIEVEPTERQQAAYALTEALKGPGETDWTAVEAAFEALTGRDNGTGAWIEPARRAAVSILEAILRGQEPHVGYYEDIQRFLDSDRGAKTIEVSDGIPEHYWQGWLIEGWLALQLAWALSGGGRWLGEAGQLPEPGADYGMGFEPLGSSAVVYATWEDSPAQIRGRLYSMKQAGKSGAGENLKIADMRGHGHLWAASDRYGVPGLTAAGEGLRLTAEEHDARLLIIDTLGVANGASEIDRAQVGAFFADWAAWADANDCAVLLITHPPKTTGVTYSGSTGILGGVRGMWSIEAVRRDHRVDCTDSKNCDCKPVYAYKLVNAKQNYAPAEHGLIWLTNQNGVWAESTGRRADYGDIQVPVEPSETEKDLFNGNV